MVWLVYKSPHIALSFGNIYFDITKAYDAVNHDILLEKLPMYQ